MVFRFRGNTRTMTPADKSGQEEAIIAVVRGGDSKP